MARRFLQSIFRQSYSFASRSPHPCTAISLVANARAPLTEQPWILTTVHHYAKRKSKFADDPYAWIKVAPDEECPSSQPNKGSVKNRNRKKRAALRDAFIKEEVQKRIAQCKAAKERKLEARKKRWKEGAARARAWKEKKLAEAKEAEAKKAAEADLSLAATG